MNKNQIKPKVGEIWEARLWVIEDIIGFFLIIPSKNRSTTHKTAVNGLALDWVKEMEYGFYGHTSGWNIIPIRRIEKANQ